MGWSCKCGTKQETGDYKRDDEANMKMREKNIGEIEGNTKEEGIETKKKKKRKLQWKGNEGWVRKKGERNNLKWLSEAWSLTCRIAIKPTNK